jgi:hypothetical protein
MDHRHAVARLAASLGFELIRRRRHAVWRHQLTGALVITSSTPSDRQALRNIERDLRRAITVTP